MISKKYDEKLLKKLIFDDNLSYESIGKMFNVTGSAIKKVALRFGMELPQRRHINPTETFNKGKYKYKKGICSICGKQFVKYPNKKSEFCSAECYATYKHKLNYQKLIDGDISIMRANYNLSFFKKDIIEEQNNVCAICGITQEWNGKELVFILDHIDGNAANNKRDNLRCVCPNCDSQLETYKSKNKNSTRSYYRYKKQKN